MSSPVTIQASDESILCSIKQLSETFGNASIALIDADNIACEHNVLANLSDTCRLLGDALTESGRLDNLLSGFIIELLKTGQADDAALLVKEQDNLSKPHALMLVSMLSLLNYESSPEFIPLVYVRRSFDVIVSLLSDIRVSLETVVSLAQQGHSLTQSAVEVPRTTGEGELWYEYYTDQGDYLGSKLAENIDVAISDFGIMAEDVEKINSDRTEVWISGGTKVELSLELNPSVTVLGGPHHD